MLTPKTKSSFYLDDNLIDTEMLKYQIRNCGAGLIHQKNQSLCKLRMVASELYSGYLYEDEILVRKWIEEL